MGSLDDLPKRPNSHDVAEASEAAFTQAINAYKLFLIQRSDRDDYGTDLEVEARDGEKMTNLRVHVQLKGTEAVANADDSISISVPRSNLNYLLSQSDSLYVCFHLPTQRLMARYAMDVYAEYQQRDAAWLQQEFITVKFRELFDQKFQTRLHARTLAIGKSSKNQRLAWAVTPPKAFPKAVQLAVADVDVPADPVRAAELLTELYAAGFDAEISQAFEKFNAVLQSAPLAMTQAYMAEINLGVNHAPCDAERVRHGIGVIRRANEQGLLQSGSALYCEGNGWLALGEMEQAKSAYLAAMGELSDSALNGIAAQCQKNLGTIHELDGQEQEARQCYERALELDPELGEAHFALGMWHQRNNGDLTVGLAHFDRVTVRRGSGSPATLQGWRTELLFRTGDYSGAYREIQGLIGQAAQHDWIWPWCARLVATYGRSSGDAALRSVNFWRAYLRARPQDVIAKRQELLCLSQAHTSGLQTGMDFSDFRAAALRLISDGDADPAFIWDLVGHWAQHDGDWDEAAAAFEQAHALVPERYGYCLGVALISLRRFDEALSVMLPQAETHYPTAESWFQVAMAREGVGDLPGSIEAFSRAIELEPDYALAWYNLGGMYWNSGNREKAVETWKVALERFPDHELAEEVRRRSPTLPPSES
jgi:tetratricopeptide (TPR) repeat protein